MPPPNFFQLSYPPPRRLHFLSIFLTRPLGVRSKNSVCLSVKEIPQQTNWGRLLQVSRPSLISQEDSLDKTSPSKILFFLRLVNASPKFITKFLIDTGSVLFSFLSMANI